MGCFCEHILDEQTVDGKTECGNEIEGMYDEYCLMHMNQYPCTKCNHTTTEHEDKSTQEREHCHKKGCKCKGYRGELQ